MQAYADPMPNFPLDDDSDLMDSLPLSPDSSVLDALYDLNPPSPILTPSQFTFSLSSGDIPVLLYDEAYVYAHGNSETSLRSLSGGGGGGDTAASGSSDDGYVHEDADWRASVASSTRSRREYATRTSGRVCSAGTFGPRGGSIGGDSRPGSSSFPSLSDDLELLQPEGSVVTECVLLESFTSNQIRHSGRRYTSTQPPGPSLGDAVSNRLSSYSTTTIRTSTTATSSCTDDVETHFANVNVDADSEGERTPTKGISSTVSWISSRDWDNQQYKDFVARHDASRFPPQVPSSSPVRKVPPSRAAHAAEERVATHFLTTPSRHDQRASRKHDTTDHGSPQTPRRSRRDKDRAPHPSPPTRIPTQFFGGDHDWLANITVHFHIDQEGFRDAQPTFKFTGLARLRSSQEVRTPDVVMAQFRPGSRQGFHFHYAPWETPPVLRRVTVNDDETHDYVSKQAYLTLKTNGVYVLHGHEMFSPAATHSGVTAGEPQRLHWQFEYLIDDRRADASNLKRDMEGEKTMTPLTFSCSPNLMLRAQAKRINILHAFKKGATPKLVAEKLQPPGAAGRRPPPTHATNSGSNGRSGACTHDIKAPSFDAEEHTTNVKFFTSKAHAWNLHRRTRSAHGRQLHGEVALQNVTNNGTRGPKSKPGITRHRRASSAGESQPVVTGRPHAGVALSSTVVPYRQMQAQEFVCNVQGHVSSAVTATAPSRFRGHIIPPAQLAKLFDHDSDLLAKEKENVQPTSVNPPRSRRNGQAGDRGSNTSGFMINALSPRPKYAMGRSPST